MASIRKRNSKYQVQVRRAGQVSINRSFQTRKDAETWARQVELSIDRRDLPPNPKVLERLTLGALVERYRDFISPRKKTSIAETLVLNAFLRHPICRKPISQVSVTDFVLYRDERLRSIKPSSLKRALVPISHMFEVARDEWGYPIKTNPVSKLKIAGTDCRRERRLKPDELRLLLEATSSRRNRYMRPLILLALSTAMRRGEMLRLTREDIDLERRTIFVGAGKNGDSRTIPLMAGALVALDGVLPSRGRIFPVSPNAVRLSWERLTARAKSEDLHFHDLRHEAISRFFEQGLSVPEVALISGHKDYRMLFRYSHAVRESILAKLDRTSNQWSQ